jgi:glycosyltransferase involved in cell wall biosynthesis
VQQRYRRWELLVIDDVGQLGSESVVGDIGDPRVRWMRIERAGVCAARNTGLAHARGELIAYLDDDNLMDPDWLYTVVWAFEQRPEADVLYGAIVIDDVRRIDGKSVGDLPRAFFRPWDLRGLRHG